MKKFYTLCLCAVLCACGGNAKQQAPATDEKVVEEKQAIQYPIHIPFEKSMQTEREVKLSDIADSVEFIRLETTDDCLINGFVSTNHLRTSKYYILPEKKNVFQFTLDGKFVRKIGRRGQGPGEFLSVDNIDVNEETGLVSIYCSLSRKINFYELETGKFIQSIRMPNADTKHTCMYNDTTLVSHILNTNGKQKIKLYFSNKDKKVLKTFTRNEEFECKLGGASISSSFDNYFYRYEDEICYKEYENDTVYIATPNELKKKYIIDLGKYSIPMEHTLPYIGNQQKYNDVASEYIRTNVVETKNFLFFPYTYWAGKNMGKLHYLVYDKRTKECFRIKDNKIVNDISGGLDFNPIWALNKNMMLDNFPAYSIHKEAKNNPEILNHPQLKGLQEDDNPVLMIVHLKQ